MDKLFATVTRKARVPAVALATSLIFGATLGYAEDVPTYPGVDSLPDIPLTISDSYAPGTSLGAGTQAFADYVAKASGGKIKPQIYWSSSLVTSQELPDAIASGIADLGLVTPIYDPASFPVANWITTLANQAGGGVPFGTQVFSGAHSEFITTTPEVRKEFEDRHLHILGAQTTPAFDLMCNKPVHTLEEAKGKRVRTAGIVFSKEAQALGMTPVPLLPTEMYEGFARGIVDCLVLHPMGYQDFGITTVEGSKYFANLEFAGFNSLYFSINKDKWDAFPDVVKQIIQDGYFELMKVQYNNTYARQQAFGQLVTEGKVVPLQPDAALIEALSAQQKEAVTAMVAAAPPGVTDPQALVDRYLALVEKWRGIVSTDLGQSPASSDVKEEVAGWAKPFDYADFVARLKAELAKS